MTLPGSKPSQALVWDAAAMAGKRWYENDSAEKWGLGVTLLLLLAVGPGIVGDALGGPSIGKFLLAVLWLAVTLAQAALLVRHIVRLRRGLPYEVRPIDPATVPADDVSSAIANTPSRVLAVKSLHEKNPGLGLKDAVDLIDGSISGQRGH